MCVHCLCTEWHLSQSVCSMLHPSLLFPVFFDWYIILKSCLHHRAALDWTRLLDPTLSHVWRKTASSVLLYLSTPKLAHTLEALFYFVFYHITGRSGFHIIGAVCFDVKCEHLWRFRVSHAGKKLQQMHLRWARSQNIQLKMICLFCSCCFLC